MGTKVKLMGPRLFARIVNSFWSATGRLSVANAGTIVLWLALVGCASSAPSQKSGAVGVDSESAKKRGLTAASLGNLYQAISLLLGARDARPDDAAVHAALIQPALATRQRELGLEAVAKLAGLRPDSSADPEVADLRRQLEALPAKRPGVHERLVRIELALQRARRASAEADRARNLADARVVLSEMVWHPFQEDPDVWRYAGYLALAQQDAELGRFARAYVRRALDRAAAPAELRQLAGELDTFAGLHPDPLAGNNSSLVLSQETFRDFFGEGIRDSIHAHAGPDDAMLANRAKTQDVDGVADGVFEELTMGACGVPTDLRMASRFAMSAARSGPQLSDLNQTHFAAIIALGLNYPDLTGRPETGRAKMTLQRMVAREGTDAARARRLASETACDIAKTVFYGGGESDAMGAWVPELVQPHARRSLQKSTPLALEWSRTSLEHLQRAGSGSAKLWGTLGELLTEITSSHVEATPLFLDASRGAYDYFKALSADSKRAERELRGSDGIGKAGSAQSFARMLAAEAAYNVAVTYNNGDGVPRDRALSQEWMQKAAALGYEPAIGRESGLRRG